MEWFISHARFFSGGEGTNAPRHRDVDNWSASEKEQTRVRRREPACPFFERCSPKSAWGSPFFFLCSHVTTTTLASRLKKSRGCWRGIGLTTLTSSTNCNGDHFSARYACHKTRAAFFHINHKNIQVTGVAARSPYVNTRRCVGQQEAGRHPSTTTSIMLRISI